MHKIYLTGSSGLIGSNLSNYYENNKYDILNISNNKKSKNSIYCDFKKESEIKNIIKTNFIPDVLIHAGWGAMSEANSEVHLNENVENSKKLFNNLVKFGLQKIIFLGSIEEYGQRNGELIENMTPLGKLRNYEKGKIKVADYGFNFAEKEKINFIHIRLANTFGFPQKENSLISTLHKCFESKEIPKFGPCNNGRDYLYVDDVVTGINSLLEIDQSTTLNLGSGKMTILKDFSKKYWSILGGDSEDIIFEVSKNDDFVRKVFLNIEKINKISGWQPELLINNAIKKMIMGKIN